MILDDEDRRVINFETSNQYMLFARNCDGLNLSVESLMLLHKERIQYIFEKGDSDWMDDVRAGHAGNGLYF